MGIIDTHAHLTCKELWDDAENILARAQAAGVDRILNVCLNPQEVEKAFALKERYSWIDVAVGFHPSDLDDFSEQDWDKLYHLLKDDRILAVGEIGLDYHWDNIDREKQKKAFVKQLQWANELQKPVLIHMRDATQDTLDIMKEFKHVPGIMHCFSGSLETAYLAIGMDMYISVGGPLTFKNAHGLPDMMAQLPMDRIFVETDCPYLTPHPFRGQRNEPKYISYTLETLANIRQITPQELNQQLKINYKKLFGL